jgi:hypothetical protein
VGDETPPFQETPVRVPTFQLERSSRVPGSSRDAGSRRHPSPVAGQESMVDAVEDERRARILSAALAARSRRA